MIISKTLKLSYDFLQGRSCTISDNYKLLMKTKIPTNKEVPCFKSPDVVFITLINVKMPTTIVGILTFMSRINFMLS